MAMPRATKVVIIAPTNPSSKVLNRVILLLVLLLFNVALYVGYGERVIAAIGDESIGGAKALVALTFPNTGDKPSHIKNTTIANCFIKVISLRSIIQSP